MTKLTICNSDDVAIVDAKDLDWLSEARWYVDRDGYVFSKHGRLQRLITACPEDRVVDHANGNKLDNRRANLRICTPAQNILNRRHYGTNKFRGVTKAGHGRYRATFRNISIGVFDTAEDAAIAWNKKASEFYGEFAKLNIV